MTKTFQNTHCTTTFVHFQHCARGYISGDVARTRVPPKSLISRTDRRSFSRIRAFLALCTHIFSIKFSSILSILRTARPHFSVFRNQNLDFWSKKGQNTSYTSTPYTPVEIVSPNFFDLEIRTGKWTEKVPENNSPPTPQGGYRGKKKAVHLVVRRCWFWEATFQNSLFPVRYIFLMVSKVRILKKSWSKMCQFQNKVRILKSRSKVLILLTCGPKVRILLGQFSPPVAKILSLFDPSDQCGFWKRVKLERGFERNFWQFWPPRAVRKTLVQKVCTRAQCGKRSGKKCVTKFSRPPVPSWHTRTVRILLTPLRAVRNLIDFGHNFYTTLQCGKWATKMCTPRCSAKNTRFQEFSRSVKIVSLTRTIVQCEFECTSLYSA